MPQHTVMDILQDKKGFMWFATWDGLSKFDGKQFTPYKIQPGDSYQMKSNRIDHIYEDKYGFLWLQSYDGEAHRFDPGTGTFQGLQSLREYEHFSFQSSRIVLMPSGKTWLLSNHTGCICIVDSSFHTEVYSQGNGRLKAKGVWNAYEDKARNTWLLTDNGLAFLPFGSKEVKTFFAEKEDGKRENKQAFFCAKRVGSQLWFGSNKGRIWKYDEENKVFDLLEIPTQSSIIAIRQVSEQEVFIASAKDGFFLLDLPSGKWQSFNTQNLPAMQTNTILSCHIDAHRNVWMDTDLLGVSKFNLKDRTFKRFSMNLEGVNYDVYPPNFFIFEDINGRLWVHPKGGGFSLYNPDKDVLEQFYNAPGSPDRRFSNMFHAAYADRQGNLWLCTRSHGLEKVVFENNVFRTNYLDPGKERSEIANDVRALFEDGQQRLWVSTKDGKIRVFSSQGKLLGLLTQQGYIGQGVPLKGVGYCITQDHAGTIWIGTKGEGVYKLQALKGSDGLRFQVSQYKKDPDDIYSISDNSVYTIYADSQDRIWVGTYGGGLNLLDRPDDGRYRFINHRNKLKTYPFEDGHQVRFITEDSKGNICVGTTIGLILFHSAFASPDNIRYKHYTRIPGDKKSLSSNDIHYIKITRKGEMYIATFGGGINKVSRYDSQGFPLTFKSYTKRQGLPADVTLAIEEDEAGQLWISTENNLTRFNPETERFETFGEIKRQIQAPHFSEAATLRLQRGEIYVGHSKGLLHFSPRSIRNNTFKPYIALEEFRLFNKSVEVGKSSVLKSNIDDLQSLSLKHNQNFFSIEYAALDYVDPQNITYAYKLDGIDSDWIYARQQQIANYTNIPKGKYTFRVKSTNSDGIWVDNERSLRIEVKPSFWETPWAYALYVLLLACIIFISVRILFIIYRLKDKVRMEHQLAELKLRFFTDISHEIRTPLTMVSSPLEYLLSNEKTPEETKYHLQLIKSNTNRILRMVNQILDFRKMQHHTPEIEQIEIASLIEDICGNFREAAEKQHIQFRFVNTIGKKTLATDRDYMEKIVFNLLSNAFKYTPDGKGVTLTLDLQAKHVSLEVRDEGNGISKEKQKLLFKRFSSFNEDKSKPSTGIGLSMVKELADKLNATISVDSEPGRGSAFTILFPLDMPVTKKEKTTKLPEEPSTRTERPNSLPEQALKTEKKESRPTVLVVEDDDELRQFIRTILKPDYLVLEAENGKRGLELAGKALPDFIVSDIMMPEMDGVELLQRLKADISTSHIPVVLLTAKTTLESKLEGLEYGADDYITKPFSVPYFKARIMNILRQRQLLHHLYINELPEQEEFEPKKPIITSQDELFMQKVIGEIEQNMNNSEFLIEDLSTSMGVSRTVFFKKIKGITGLAPVEFIRDMRLKRGRQLLDSEQYSVKEIAFMIGMSDPAYFRKCFKQKFGLTPAEYRKEKGER